MKILDKQFLFSFLLLIFSKPLTSQILPTYVPANGLIGWWSFDGNGDDSSGNKNNGIVSGAILTTDRNGKPNSAYSFDGNNDYIIINNNNSVNPTSISISGWFLSRNIATNADGGAKAIFTKWYQRINCGGAGDNYSVQITKIDQKNNLIGVTGVENKSSNSVKSGNDLIPIGKWRHFVLTHDENFGERLYLDGSLIGVSSIDGKLCKTTNSIYIGADNNFGSLWRFFDGKLDDFGMWDRELTIAEVRKLYNGLPLSNSELRDDQDFRISPNPFTTSFSLEVSENLKDQNFSILDFQGKVVFKNKILSPINHVDMENFPNGVYFLLIDNKRYEINKLLKVN